MKVADLAGQLPENGRFVGDDQRIVVVVEEPRAVVEEVEGAEAELVTAEAEEPEVIGRTRTDEETDQGS